MTTSTNGIKPFLRWAGGKNWLVKNIDSYLPYSFNDYYEPFLGGGSIFIHLNSLGIIKNKAFLSDINLELINSYSVVKNNINEVLDHLATHKNEKDYYYYLREQQFDNSIHRASKFIFLNRTSYNGIYRENLKGVYNVPFGYKNYNELFDFDNFKKLSQILSNSDFSTCDFETLTSKIKKNDLVFIDPPYTVAHGMNGFIKYNQKIFSWSDQLRLKKFITKIDKIGAHYIMTNACHESILALFKNSGTVHIQSRPSLVGGKGATRTKYDEILITNVKR